MCIIIPSFKQNIARSKKAELEALSNENLQLKENLKEAMKVTPSPKVSDLLSLTIETSFYNSMTVKNTP